MSYANDLELRTALRKPFAPKLVKKLPKTEKRPALDYVPHGIVTDHLNLVVPGWTYTIDAEFTHAGTYWVRGTMTIADVSRAEYGDGDDPKDAIGNFIRRGAMRFGVGLDLWIKGEASAKVEPRSTVTGSSEATGMAKADGSGAPASDPTSGGSAAYGEGAAGPLLITDEQVEVLKVAAGGVQKARAASKATYSKDWRELTADEALKLIQQLQKVKEDAA